jgi:hypothetical protein
MKQMYAISNSLSKQEAIDFAKTLDKDETWYITCVHRNLNERRAFKRERYVVVRDLHTGEVAPDGYELNVSCVESAN